jgi:hypothetical protein
MIDQEGAAPGNGAAPESCDQPQHEETKWGRTRAGEQTDWKDLPLDAEHVAMLVASGCTAHRLEQALCLLSYAGADLAR